MITTNNTNPLFWQYYKQWIEIYKEGAVRKVTLQKYTLALKWIKKTVPTLRIEELDRITYQSIINQYAQTHERQTTMDFHHLLKSAVLDAVDEGFIKRDPTRKVIIKGKTPNSNKKQNI